MSGFNSDNASFDSPIYNPSFYPSISEGSGIDLTLADQRYASINDLRLSYTDSITAGTASAGKALVVDAFRSISNIGELSCTGLLVNGAPVASQTDVGFISGITAGVAASNKAMVLNSNRDITNVNSMSLNGSNNVLTLANGNNSTRTTIFFDGSIDWELGTRNSGTTNPNSFYLYGNGAYRLIINQNGDMAIGGTSITDKLTVDGSVNANDYKINGTSFVAPITGITNGTAAANKALIVDSNRDIANIRRMELNGANDIITFNNTTAGSLTYFLFNGDQRSFEVGTRNSSLPESNSFYIYDRTDAQFRFIIRANGNIGIGVLNPSEKLEVDGRVKCSEMIIGNVNLNQDDVSKLDDITNGTASANKCLILNGSSNINGINDIEANSFKLSTDTGVSLGGINTAQMVISTSGQECMRISDNGGGVLIGANLADSTNTSIPAGSLYVKNNIICSGEIDCNSLSLNGTTVLNFQSDQAAEIGRIRLKRADEVAGEKNSISGIFFNPVDSSFQTTAIYQSTTAPADYGGICVRSEITAINIMCNNLFGGTTGQICRFGGLFANTPAGTDPYKWIDEGNNNNNFNYRMGISWRDNVVFNHSSVGLNLESGGGNFLHLAQDNSPIMLASNGNVYFYPTLVDWSTLDTTEKVQFLCTVRISEKLAIGTPLSGNSALTIMNDALADNEFIRWRLGKQDSTANSFSCQYNHIGNGNLSNRLSFQASGRSNDFNIHANGNCSIRSVSNAAPLVIDASTCYTFNPTNDFGISYRYQTIN